MKIVVIDDDPTLLITLKAMLADLGHDVIAHQNGRDVLLFLEDMRDDIDLVITDIVMPDIDGFEFVEGLKKANIDKPIIMMSGGGGKLSADDIMNIARNVADHVLPKPFTLEELNEAIEKMMNTARED